MKHGGKIVFYSVFVLLWIILAALPWLGFSYGVVWIFLLAVSFTLALSYDIVGGYMGYMNLGHSTFFGLGAYTTAILLNQGFNLFTSLLAAFLLAAFFAALISYPLFRLRGAYFALATFGLISLIEVLTVNLRDLTGGSGGISTPPGNHMLPAYYMVLGVAAATMVLSHSVARSKFGLGLFSIREDEEVAQSFGVPTSLYKGLALVISSVPASLVGGIYVWNMTYVSPESVFGLEIALSPIIMAMLGGTGVMIGPLVGAVFITLVQEFLWTKVPYFHLAMYGTVLVLLGLFMPGGIVRTRWVKPFIQRLGLGEAVEYFKNVDAERMS
ncbi:MAG: hypothetical protein B1H11_07275 [Desulfobacteraceae bacterium 4484_190.1]|nr:MAG: hypothetical protein B1H11_07275 [Desulfobacteraceae bacterium 4484_190.1]